MSILYSVLVLGIIALAGAVALYVVAKKFYVYEDPRIAQVEDLLPGANCGACGRNGCHDFATACIEAGNLDGLFCPSAGSEGMKQIAQLLGCDAVADQPDLAIVRCAGTSETKKALNARYVGPRICSVMNMTAGDYACLQSCLGCGDCTKVCAFNAIQMVSGSDTPQVDADLCTGCGKCATACPRNIIEVRARGPRSRAVWVACSNCAKGAETRRQCTVGCIACGKCVKTCPFDAITIINNTAHIDAAKCKTCGKCIPVCPVHAIHSVNMPVKPVAQAAPERKEVPDEA